MKPFRVATRMTLGRSPNERRQQRRLSALRALCLLRILLLAGAVVRAECPQAGRQRLGFGLRHRDFLQVLAPPFERIT